MSKQVYKVGDLIKITKTNYVGELKDFLLNGVHEVKEVDGGLVYVYAISKNWALAKQGEYFDCFHKVYKRDLEALK